MTTGLRVCLIASARFPVAEPFMGGLESHTHALATHLAARGHEVAVFAAPGSDASLPVRALRVSPFRGSEAARADVSAPPETWMEEHHAYLDLMLALASGEHGEFDVVHNNSLHHLPVAMSPMIPAPLVTTLHTPPLAWLESASRFSRGRDVFVAVSRSVARQWSSTLRAEVVHNGIDTDLWCTGPGGGPAVWTGRLVPEKAPHEAIDAARLAGLELVLAGPTHDPAYFRGEIEPRLGSGVTYAGHLGGRRLRELVGAASVALVTPRWQEPFGLVAAEALACGTPVAAYDAGALGEIVDDAVGRLAPAGDVRALAAAALRAAALDRRVVRARAQERYGLARMVTAYEAIYARVADSRGAA